MTMEDLIQEFIRVDDQSDDGAGLWCDDRPGNGAGFGIGSGSKFGIGCGTCYCCGLEDGSGDGSGIGSGFGYIYGASYGEGEGSGMESGHGHGYGEGSGCNLKTLKGSKVYIIDNTQTIISQVRGNTAKGYIVQGDLILRECYVVKQNNLFAHGNTLHDAYQALQEKLYDTSTEEERISAFKEKFQDFDMKYPAKDLFSWHHILTGSCRAGREAFCRDHEIDVENDSFTIHEFIRLTKDSYNGEIIQKLLD